jgi:hypothetical protein
MFCHAGIAFLLDTFGKPLDKPSNAGVALWLSWGVLSDIAV